MQRDITVEKDKFDSSNDLLESKAKKSTIMNAGEVNGEDLEQEPLVVATEEPSTKDELPWYLQMHQSTEGQNINSLSARQRIPDLPAHSPTILQSLLEHVSVELGMDDLTILDLRSLDPPPALGANLFMIIGTARSEKHLHVSADRLCRWLRSTYKLRPYADGLLGRNELKLKMRRKAKRSRLMSAVGASATADSEIDDGIRTGWVCVNVGKVEGGELPKTEGELRREENVVGFGTQTAGSNIVVQMMTEEKRGEIDLENLWNQVLHHAAQRKDGVVSEHEGEESEQPAIDTSTHDPPATQVTPVDATPPLRAYASTHRTTAQSTM